MTVFINADRPPWILRSHDVADDTIAANGAVNSANWSGWELYETEGEGIHTFLLRLAIWQFISLTQGDHSQVWKSKKLWLMQRQ